MSQTIFFARSYLDFGSDYEKKFINDINKTWLGCTILEFPTFTDNGLFGRGRYYVEEMHFFPLINKCDILIAIPLFNTKGKNKGKFSAGVVIEIVYALKTGKRVVGLIGDKLKGMELNDLDEYYKNKNTKAALDLLSEQLET